MLIRECLACVLFEATRHTKVTHNHAVTLINKQVVRLQVTVHHPLAVEVLQAGRDLPQQVDASARVAGQGLDAAEQTVDV